MNDPIDCRDMELLCRHRATFDIQHSWKWLGEAERWKDLAHRETASRFHAEHAGPMTMGVAPGVGRDVVDGVGGDGAEN
jgi:hypothetical protein